MSLRTLKKEFTDKGFKVNEEGVRCSLVLRPYRKPTEKVQATDVGRSEPRWWTIHITMYAKIGEQKTLEPAATFVL